LVDNLERGSNFLLKGKLQKTDWLIDPIVYKLYGLTEEEIKIVEGKS
jgi:type II restriction/modification system DNA methylase subunit YeeA